MKGRKRENGHENKCDKRTRVRNSGPQNYLLSCVSHRERDRVHCAHRISLLISPGQPLSIWDTCQGSWNWDVEKTGTSLVQPAGCNFAEEFSHLSKKKFSLAPGSDMRSKFANYEHFTRTHKQMRAKNGHFFLKGVLRMNVSDNERGVLSSRDFCRMDIFLKVDDSKNPFPPPEYESQSERTLPTGVSLQNFWKFSHYQMQRCIGKCIFCGWTEWKPWLIGIRITIYFYSFMAS